MKFLIKGAEVWEENIRKQLDILIEDGFIKELGEGITNKNTRVIDANGCVALPLFVDLHCHLRTPGEEHKENLETGLGAALKGGFHTVVAMPNTKPPIDKPELVRYLIDAAAKLDKADLKVAGAITENLQGKRRTSLESLFLAGASAASDDGYAVNNTGLLLESFKEAAILDMPIFLHEEDYELSNRSGINEGRVSFEAGVFGNHPLSEALPAARDILLARQVGARVHIQHVSSKETVDVLKMLKFKNITAEATPHHLIFDESATLSLNPLYKTNPPLRSKEDREAILEAVKSGLIDCIATDHAPHTVEDKSLPYEDALSGMAWFELVFPAIYTYLVLKELLSPGDLVRLLTINPCRILKISKRPRISVGERANIAIFDVSTKKSLEKIGSKSKASNNPLFSTELFGFTKAVFKDGKLRFLEETFLEGEEN
ncbi:MAG: dihydroorotase [Actinobacteria bacterium]|nr:dihydroorotase [Actinomycetota bacterium]